MSKSTRVWLLLGILFTVYLIYICGSAALIAPRFDNQYILPFFGELNLNATSTLMNLEGTVTILIWLVWGIKFVRESDRD